MLSNYYRLFKNTIEDNSDGKGRFVWWMMLLLPVWVFVGFMISQCFVSGLVWLLGILNISLNSFDQTVYSASLSALMYLIASLIIIGMPWVIMKIRTNKAELGLSRLPTWVDILMSPAGLVVYLILSSLLMLFVTKLFPGFDINQAQDTGFNNLNRNFEYILAFLTLVVAAPVAEEVLFRGYLYGKLKKYIPIWAAILIVSLLFGALHGSWNLFVDTFALSIVLCLLRESTESLWSSILLHMLKNGIAFYLLFINPLILTTLGA